MSTQLLQRCVLHLQQLDLLVARSFGTQKPTMCLSL
jgi:hypothetical protein